MSQSKCSLAIKLDNNQNAIYNPGQIVSGHVIFTLPTRRNLRGLQLRIKGFAKCSMDVGRTRCSSEQLYFHYVRDLFGKKHGTSMEVDAGEWIYPFEYELPTNIAYSNEGKYGEIYYGIKVILNIPEEIDKEIKLPLTVVRYEDLNAMPSLKYPKSETRSESFRRYLFCCLDSPPLVLSVSLPYCGFVPGSEVPVVIEMKNQSHIDVKGTKITLKGLHRFNFDYPKPHTQIEKYRLDYKFAGGVQSGKCIRLEEYVKIPDMLTPSNETNCKIFQISYVVKVAAIVDANHRSVFVHIPITVGSFPLIFKEANEELQNPSRIFDCGRKTKTAQTLYNEIIRLNEF